MTEPAVTVGRYAPAARRFPLAPRPKPPCRPLEQRLDRATRLASHAQASDPGATLRAAEACNLAALIASDCAMPDLARDLCWQHFDAYATAGPYDEAGAKLALQPLVNLARLRIRDGDGGYQLLQAPYDAVRSRGQAVIDGRPVSTAALVAPGGTGTESPGGCGPSYSATACAPCAGSAAGPTRCARHKSTTASGSASSTAARPRSWHWPPTAGKRKPGSSSSRRTPPNRGSMP